MKNQPIRDLVNIDMTDYLYTNDLSLIKYLVNIRLLAKYIAQLKDLRDVVIMPRHIEKHIEVMFLSIEMEHEETFAFIEIIEDWKLSEYIDYLQTIEITESMTDNLIYCANELRYFRNMILMGVRIL